MANFKTHISTGIILGMGSAFLASTYLLSSDNTILALAFIFVIIGSFLPDLDSDEGQPLRIVLHLFALLCSLAVFLYLKQTEPRDTLSQIFSLLVVYGTVRYGLIWILKKFTHHRGIFHSIPAMLLAFLTALLVLNNFDLRAMEKLLIAASLAVGFLGHLILDEIKSATSFNGFHVSKSLGSALKLASRSKTANITVYALLAVTAYLNLPLLRYCYQFFVK